MSEETATLKRESTMAVTAEEGEKFLEEQGGVDEDAKTRGQQKKLDEIESENGEEALKRATTMDTTAKEGAELLQGAELGKTRAETEQKKEEEEENGTDSVEKQEDEVVEQANGNSEDHTEEVTLKRKGTMAVTAEEGEEFLKRQKLKDGDEVEEDSKKEVEA